MPVITINDRRYNLEGMTEEALERLVHEDDKAEAKRLLGYSIEKEDEQAPDEIQSEILPEESNASEMLDDSEDDKSIKKKEKSSADAAKKK